MQQILTQDNADEAFEAFHNRVKAFWNWEQHPKAEIEIRPAKTKRSLDQNSLFWKWMEELSTYFTRNGRPISKDDAHDLMCHKFLGYEEKTIGATSITKLKSTRDLGTAEFSEFLDLIDHWAIEMGLRLPTPADVAHDRYMKTQSRKVS